MINAFHCRTTNRKPSSENNGIILNEGQRITLNLEETAGILQEVADLGQKLQLNAEHHEAGWRKR